MGELAVYRSMSSSQPDHARDFIVKVLIAVFTALLGIALKGLLEDRQFQVALAPFKTYAFLLGTIQALRLVTGATNQLWHEHVRAGAQRSAPGWLAWDLAGLTVTGAVLVWACIATSPAAFLQRSALVPAAGLVWLLVTRCRTQDSAFGFWWWQDGIAVLALLAVAKQMPDYTPAWMMLVFLGVLLFLDDFRRQLKAIGVKTPQKKERLADDDDTTEAGLKALATFVVTVCGFGLASLISRPDLPQPQALLFVLFLVVPLLSGAAGWLWWQHMRRGRNAFPTSVRHLLGDAAFLCLLGLVVVYVSVAPSMTDLVTRSLWLPILALLWTAVEGRYSGRVGAKNACSEGAATGQFESKLKHWAWINGLRLVTLIIGACLLNESSNLGLCFLMFTSAGFAFCDIVAQGPLFERLAPRAGPTQAGA